MLNQTLRLHIFMWFILFKLRQIIHMKNLFAVLVSCFICFHVAAQQKATVIDFTATDITQADTFQANTVMIFGGRLGMNKKNAIAALKARKDIVWEYDNFNTVSQDVNSKTETRIYIYKKDPVTKGKGASLLYFIWDKGSTGIDRIIFFKDMAPMAVGDTKKLFVADAIDPGSEFYKRFLIKFDKETTSPYTTEHNYNAKKIQVIQLKQNYAPNDIYFSLDRTLK